ncbi:MAG: hypothetical protein HYR91_06895 [Flavobacteriia bacterium]|nr:hypothetical protein [Flavobacteriia bacterium]
MKKYLLSIATVVVSIITFSQNVEIDERNATFNAGSRNAIYVSIPHVTVDFIEKKIKDEVKDWGGKYNSSKGEYTSMQAQIKEMGEKMFDGYAKIVSEKDGNVVVAFAFDLGGAFMTSSEHKTQYSAMAAKLKDFGVNAAKDFVSEEIKDQEKILKSLMKDQESLVSTKSDLEKDIEDYKKKIAEAEKKIEENKSNQEKMKEEIKTQEVKVEEVNKKLKGIK